MKFLRLNAENIFFYRKVLFAFLLGAFTLISGYAILEFRNILNLEAAKFSSTNERLVRENAFLIEKLGLAIEDQLQMFDIRNGSTDLNASARLDSNLGIEVRRFLGAYPNVIAYVDFHQNGKVLRYYQDKYNHPKMEFGPEKNFPHDETSRYRHPLGTTILEIEVNEKSLPVELGLPGQDEFGYGILKADGTSWVEWKSSHLQMEHQCSIPQEQLPFGAIKENISQSGQLQVHCKNENMTAAFAAYPFHFLENNYALLIAIPYNSAMASLTRAIHSMIIILFLFSALALLFYVFAFQVKQFIDTQDRVNHARLVNASRLNSIGEMAGGIAHEINNPLSVIHGAITVMKRHIGKGDIQGEALLDMINRIERMATRMEKIVKSLRTFSRDGSKTPKEDFLVNAMVEDAIEMAREKIRNSGIDLILELAPDNPWVHGNSVQLGQVIINLLNNAYDSVKTNPQQTAPPQIKVAVQIIGEDLRISIEDNGPGISPENAERIFAPFFTTKGVGKGTGLGLSISIGIIQDHHGQLTLESKANPTRFVLKIPQKERNINPEGPNQSA